jgi:succinate dehydrogenase hydrophobic anchor subunit
MRAASAQRPAAWEHRAAAEQPAPGQGRLASYVALRVTGVALSVLVLGHFAVTHIVTDVAHDDATFVTRRLSSAVWIAWDGTMLAAALAHAAIGIRLALADYAATRARRSLLNRLVIATAGVLLVLGVVAISRAAHA